MGDDGDPAPVVDGGDRVGEGEPCPDGGDEADAEHVPVAGGDLLADHQLDREPFIARAADELPGDADPVVVGEDGNLQAAGPERGIERRRRPGADAVTAGMDVEVRATD